MALVTQILLAIKIGFIEIHILDLIDVFLVSLLLFQLYKLLKGSLAFNIFLGLLLIFLSWFLVRALEMRLLEGILSQFIGLGVIALLIVFQPEVRRFLLYLGKGSHLRRNSVIRKLLQKDWSGSPTVERETMEIVNAVRNMANEKVGALIVFARTSRMQSYANTGVELDAKISSKLLESIFDKSTPLHDGAVIIANNLVHAASCTLPISENMDLPERIGLRHKSAVGITEQSDAVCIVVSEETGTVSLTENGGIQMGVSMEVLSKKVKSLIEEMV